MGRRRAWPGPAQHRHHAGPAGPWATSKPRADYSLGAYACCLRDPLDALGHDRVTVVGHSFGGGIAMQFAYQFPERCERLVLVASGGLGDEVNVALRAGRRRSPGPNWSSHSSPTVRSSMPAGQRGAGPTPSGLLRVATWWSLPGGTHRSPTPTPAVRSWPPCDRRSTTAASASTLATVCTSPNTCPRC
ncbi:MAG: alpha/beta fold hydrolase [Actinomycetota bacterium]|nr:alpha/beta fold hydrolase [Actinomycetota bacterium]